MKYVSRKPDGSIGVIMDDLLPGYALDPVGDELPAEAMADDAPEMVAEMAARANTVPATASSGDLVSALIDLGWYDAVDAAATAAGGRALALWRHASVFERYNPILIGIGRAIGKTDADLDALFIKTRDYQ